MIRKKRLYKRPMQLYDSVRIKEENELVKKYGLKNKKEIWKALAKINYYRKRAMDLANLSSEEQQVFFNKLNNIGFKVDSISDALGLKLEDLLERRLPTIVAKQKLASTVKHARQMIAHKRIMVNHNVINSPSYIVQVDEENKISVKEKTKKEVKA